MDVESGVRLPLYSCPFKHCAFSTESEPAHYDHIASRQASDPHYAVIHKCCGKHLARISAIDFVHRAVTLIEQQQIPLVGASTTRRSLNALTSNYKDEKIKALACFACGQIKVALGGAHSGSISMKPRFELQRIERERPGTLLKKCSYD